MKKILSLLLALIMLLSLSTVALAADYDQIFPKGLLGADCYRIPAIYTLQNGSVIAAADMRYAHGADSPNNIETVIAKSNDGYTGWTYDTINYFDDYADGETNADSASFIDTAIVQSKTGRIFTIVDAFPSGYGYRQAKRGTGFATIDGKSHMLLTKGSSSNAPSSFEYYVGDYEGEFAPVLNRADSSATAYTLDREFNIYQNGKALSMAQKGSEGVKVQQNVFYSGAALHCYATPYLWLRYSDDNGKSWSDPVILNPQVKSDQEIFLGICPGRGITTTLEDGTERILFAVYDNGSVGLNIVENVSTIYSDDNGLSWHRGKGTTASVGIGKTSESQMVELNNGVIRMFSRTNSDVIGYADSTDGGISWTDFSGETDLSAHGNCMCSFINTRKTIGGKKVVLGSYPSNTSSRADGVIRVGVVENDNSISWISSYHVNSGFYAYSCLTELSDGSFALLYEDEAAHISYMIFSVSDDGTVSEINGNNEEYKEPELNFWQKIVQFFNKIFSALKKFFGIY